MPANFYFNLPYYSYGMLIVIGFLAGLMIYRFNCRRLGIVVPDLLDLSLTITIAPLVGARILYIITFPHQFNGLADYLAIHEGGLIFYGGLLAGLLALAIFAQQKRIPLRQLLDLIVPSFAFAHVLGRFGCLINGCCYGKPTVFLQIYRLAGDPQGLYRHPTQLYEAIFLLILFAVLNKLLTKTYRLNSLFAGFVSGFYLIAYSFFRFLIEFIRDDDRGGFFTFLYLSPSQIVALILVISGIFWLNHCYKYPYNTGDKSNGQN